MKPDFPGYEIFEILYESSRSRVYRSCRKADHQPIILKVLHAPHPTPYDLARFRSEYALTRRLEGDGIIAVFDLAPWENTLLMTFEDFGGNSLDRILPRAGFDLRAFLQLAIRITEIVGNIHQRNVIHKDLNPSNIVWNPKTNQVKIIDFGIATEMPREIAPMRPPNLLEGTFAYISPEQTGRLNRSLDYRSDLYSLGVTLYELLTGQLPFDASDALALVHCHIAHMPAPPHELPGNARIPPPLSAIVMKLMGKMAEERYQSAAGVQADLQCCLDQVNATGRIVPFEIGRLDSTGRFRIPEKLYGREHEIATLRQAFSQLSGDKHLLLVTGQAGIGKSSFIHEIQQPIIEKQGHFIAGKFEQLKRNIPYFAFIQAFQRLIFSLWAETGIQGAGWKERLLHALGPNGQVMLAVIPELELLIGPQPAAPELPPLQAQNRFSFVFQNFVRACAAVEHPLVLFLDDLQWADSSSLSLLELLMSDPALHSLLIIGAYRDHEVNDAHPLMLKLHDMRQTGARFATITLSPLNRQDVTQLAADTLRKDVDTCVPLAELLLQKTGGNPFFLKQFLTALHHDGLLTFGRDQTGWTWDLEAIRQAQSTDNVVDLMAHTIQKLPPRTIAILTYAACIGTRFDLNTLALGNDQSAAQTLHDIWEALQRGLLVPLDDSYKYVTSAVESGAPGNPVFAFLHDRVQQAAYGLLDDRQKQERHLKIGRRLLANTPEAERGEHIFDIVRHFNNAKNLTTEDAEKVRLAELNLLAGRRAKASAAYQPALSYALSGLELLDEQSWRQRYDLTLALHIETAEAAYVNGDIERTASLSKIIFAHAQTVLEKAQVYEILLQAYMSDGAFTQAIQSAREALRLLGVTVPENPGYVHLAREWLTTQRALFGKPIETLAELPDMTDPEKKAAMRILITVSTSAYYGLTPKLMGLLILNLMNISLKYGNAPESSCGYASYGFFLCTFLGDLEASNQFADLALRVSEKFDARMYIAKLYTVVYRFIKPWTHHNRDIAAPLLSAYQSGLETGDILFAMLAYGSYFTAIFLSSQGLSEIARELRGFFETLRQRKQQFIINQMSPSYQFVLNLMGPADDPCLLVGEVYDERSMLPQQSSPDHNNELFYVDFSKALLCYFFESFPQALEHVRRVESHSVQTALIAPMICCYGALIRLALYSTATKREQRQYRKHVRVSQRKLKKWARYAPMNYLHKFYLVEAEQARAFGKHAEAMDYYDKAISLARQHAYINEEALANELAAQFHIERGKMQIARAYMQEARSGYRAWGAFAKVRDLEQRYPMLLTPAYDHTVTTLKLTETSTPETTAGMLDLMAVIKASRVLAGEIVLEKLLITLIRLVMESAGAQKALLLLARDADWYIEAEGATDSTEVTVLQSLPALRDGAPPLIPRTLISYVIHSHNTVVLHDAAREGQFVNDPYMRVNCPKSVLCLPLLNQGVLSGILYVENNLTTYAFIPERVDVLQMLSSQAAISIEHARLYSTLEQKVEERTHTLADNLERLQREIAERQRIEAELHAAKAEAESANNAKSEFLAHMSHELRTPLNGILGYAQLLEQDTMLTENQRSGLHIIQRSGQNLLNLINEILNLAQIEARKLELHPTEVALAEFLRDITALMTMRAQQKGLAFHYAPEADLPVIVLIDRQRLEQVLLNLLNNAVKFTEQGRVTLKVTNVTNVEELPWEGEGADRYGLLHGEAVNSPLGRGWGWGAGAGVASASGTHPLPLPGGESVAFGDIRDKSPIPVRGAGVGSQLAIVNLQFSIEDTGLGIPADKLTAIFEPFERVGGHAHQIEGTGLGLAISQQLVQLMGGRIEVSSQLGRGSTFWFELTLPVKASPMITAVSATDMRIGFAGTCKVLIVDDIPSNRMVLRDILRPLGFDVREAGDGASGIAAALEFQPDAILLDVMLPDMDGAETARKIRQIDTLRKTVLIGCSASVSETVQERMRAGGCRDFLPKPVQYERLLDCLGEHLTLHWQYRPHAEQPSAGQNPLDETGLTVPPRADVQRLYDFARRGDILEVEAYAKQLAENDPAYRVFSAKLIHWRKTLDILSIRQYLESSLR